MTLLKTRDQPANPLFTNKALRALIIPLVIEQVLAITVGMADTMMISNVGEAAVSGVSLVDMINVVLINVFAALATGGSVVAAQFIGARKQKQACDAAKQLILISLIAALVITAGTLIARRPLLRLFFGSIEADVMNHALLYLIFSAASYPFLALYNAGAALFRSMGNSRVSMMTSILMNVINIIGNAVLIFGFGMGVAGAAIATLVSRIVASVIMLILIGSPVNEIHINWKESWKLDGHMIRKILRIGVPNGLENSFFQLGRVLVVSIIAAFGTTQIAANAVANNLDSLGIIPGQAMNLAMITVVGQCVGAGDYQQATFYVKKLLKMEYLMMIGLNAVILLCMRPLLQIYSLSAETLDLAMILVLIHDGAAMVLWPLSFTVPNALRAANDVKFTMIVSIFSMVTFRLLFSYILGVCLGWGAVGVWTAMIMDWIFRVICFVARFIRGKWKTIYAKTA